MKAIKPLPLSLPKMLFVSLFVLLGLSSASAQIRLDGQIDFTPANPKPYEKIRVTLKSFSFDVNSASISWYVNKVLVAKGVGEKSFSIDLGPANKTYYIGVDAVSAEGQSFQDSIDVTPQFTPLLIEGYEGYVPPFYEGRSLYGESAKVRVVAFPIVTEGGTPLNKKNMVYRWKVNTIPFSEAGGYGKNSFVLRQDELEEENNVDVTVTSLSGNTSLVERASIRPYEIEPLFYEYDPLYGVNLGRAYEGTLSIKRPIKIYYAPYNFSYSKSTSFFNWSLNGLPVVADSDFLVNLIPKENSRGVSIIGITAQHTTKLLQALDSTININFDTTKNE
jgi:hypothetical protein